MTVQDASDMFAPLAGCSGNKLKLLALPDLGDGILARAILKFSAASNESMVSFGLKLSVVLMVTLGRNAVTFKSFG